MKQFNLLWISVAGIVGASHLAQADAPQPKQPEPLKAWKIQPVAMPTIDAQTAHQALLSRQQQLTGKIFSCDCPSCKLAAKQLGVTLN